MTQVSQKAGLIIPLPLVWTTTIALIALGLGTVGIMDNNEGLYAEISREMLTAENWRGWIIPHLNALPYMEKPPLLYWLTALSFALFGEVEWAARVVPALSALACVAMLVRFGASVNRPQAGRLAALMFISGVGVNVMSHVLMFDMLLTALLTAALICAYRDSVDGKPRSVRWAYGWLAFALLAKGFVALILFVLVVGGFLIVTRRSFAAFGNGLKSWCDPWGLAIFLGIAAPWHIAASLVEPIFPWFYFINEHVLRFLGVREPHDYYGGSWWYYLPRMAIYLFPWSFLLPCLLGAKRCRKNSDAGELQRFLWLAWLTPLIFFSVSNAKANYYLIAVMPFAAFHLATAVEDRIPLNGWGRALPGVLIAVLSIIIGFAMTQRVETPNSNFAIWGNSPQEFVIWFCAGMAVIAVGSALSSWRFQKIGVLAFLSLAIYPAITITLVSSQIEPFISMRLVAQYLQSELSGRSVYLYQNFEERSSLPFYMKRPVPIIDSHSNDLFWGNKLKANDIVISKDQFDRRAQRGLIAVVVAANRRKEFMAEQFSGRFKSDKRIGETSIFIN